MSGLNTKIRLYLNREVEFGKDVILFNDGDGVAYIKEWNVVEAQPNKCIMPDVLAPVIVPPAKGNLVSSDMPVVVPVTSKSLTLNFVVDTSIEVETESESLTGFRCSSTGYSNCRAFTSF